MNRMNWPVFAAFSAFVMISLWVSFRGSKDPHIQNIKANAQKNKSISLQDVVDDLPEVVNIKLYANDDNRPVITIDFFDEPKLFGLISVDLYNPGPGPWVFTCDDLTTYQLPALESIKISVPESQLGSM